MDLRVDLGIGMENRDSRVRVLPAFCGMVLVAVLVYPLMNAVAKAAAGSAMLTDFVTIMSSVTSSFSSRVLWFIDDITEGMFLAAVPASLLLVLGTCIGAYLEKRKAKGAGTGVDGNSNVFVAYLLSGLASLIIGQVCFSGWFANGYVPTFAPLIAITAMIIAFQANTFAKAATVTLIGTFVDLPVCYLIMTHFTVPFNLPVFVAVGGSVMISVAICSEIMLHLPWMKKAAAPVEKPEAADEPAATTALQDNVRFANRIFGDVGEMILWGSSIGVILMYVGCIISLATAPDHAGFNIPMVASMQILTGAVAVFVYWPRWQKEGWAFTFAPLLVVSAITVTYPNTPQILIPTVLVAVFLIQPLLDWLLKVTKYNGRWHIIVHVLVAILSVCIPWSFFCANVLA